MRSFQLQEACLKKIFLNVFKRFKMFYLYLLIDKNKMHLLLDDLLSEHFRWWACFSMGMDKQKRTSHASSTTSSQQLTVFLGPAVQNLVIF